MSDTQDAAILQRPRSAEPYDVEVIQIGGKEPDGTPSAIGRWTFQTRKVRREVEKELQGRVLNACAGKTKLTHGGGEIVRNDLNPEIDADHHVDVVNARNHFDDRSFDAVIFDPPFDQEQADEHYESMHNRQRGPARKALAKLVRPSGVFVELGWTMHGAAKYEGWSRDRMVLFDRGPTIPPVFMVVDRFYQQSLDGGCYVQ